MTSKIVISVIWRELENVISSNMVVFMVLVVLDSER